MNVMQERLNERVDVYPSITLKGHRGVVSAVIALIDKELIISGGSDGLRVWDYEGNCRKMISESKVYDLLRNGYEEFTSFHTNGFAIRWKVSDFEKIDKIPFLAAMDMDEPSDLEGDLTNPYSNMIHRINNYFDLYATDEKFRKLTSHRLKFYIHDEFGKDTKYIADVDLFGGGMLLYLLKNIDFNEHFPDQPRYGGGLDDNMSRMCVSAHNQFVTRYTPEERNVHSIYNNSEIESEGSLGRGTVKLSDEFHETNRSDRHEEIGQIYSTVRFLRYWNRSAGFFGECDFEEAYHRGKVTSFCSYTFQDEENEKKINEVLVSADDKGRMIFWKMSWHTAKILTEEFFEYLKSKNRLIECGVGVWSLLQWGKSKIIAGLENGSIEIFSIGSKSSIRRKQDAHKSKVVDLQWMSKNQFVSCSLDGEVKIWNVLEDGLIVMEDEKARIEFLKEDVNQELFENMHMTVSLKNQDVTSFKILKTLIL